jgi:hypothetical protein
MQMPITMDNTHAVIFYGTSARFTVPKKASGRDLAFEAFWFHFVLIGKQVVGKMHFNLNLANSVRIGIMDLLGMSSVLFSSPCPFLSRARLTGRTAAHQELLQIGQAENRRYVFGHR